MKKCKIRFFVLMSCLFLSTSLFAQEKIITGTITDINSLPTPGVNITIKGTNKGTQTNFDGKYTLNASSNLLQFLAKLPKFFFVFLCLYSEMLNLIM